MGAMDDSRELDGRQVGQAAHLLIASLVQKGLRRPSPEDLFAAVASSDLVAARVSSYRQAAKQRLLGAASLYFRFFALGEGWSFAGAEVSIDGGRLDLVWEGTGGVLSDEIKTGWPRDLAERRELEDQIGRQLAGARRKFGPSFAGIRVLILGRPGASFLLKADGSREPLTVEADDE
jgi:hypothetical protein